MGLACFRITLMLTHEAGPYELFASMRDLTVNTKWSPLHCFYCTSVWVAFFFALFCANFFLSWMAISAGAIVVFEALGGDRE